VDLALALLAPSVEDKARALTYFDANAPLIHNQLIELVADPSQPQPPLLAKYLKVNDRIASFLLGSDELDDRIQSFTIMRDPQEYCDSLLVADDVKRRLMHFLKYNSLANGVIFYLRGPYGVGRQKTAEAVCREQGLRLLIADLEWLSCNEDGSCEQISGDVQREAKLQQAAVYWKGFDTILDEKKKGVLRRFVRQLEERPALTFLAGETIWQPADSLREAPYAQIELGRPTSAERVRMWTAAVNGNYVVNPEVDLSALATKFKFTGGQILDAAATTENLARQRETQPLEIMPLDLYEACRMHSNQNLALLAKKITPKYEWHDIVLPDDRLKQLREICNYVKYRARVYDEWGFDLKLSLGKGLSVLFAGPSGTGKTMAAEIIAGELGLELYKIDLSTVVSKYIGETEKNLSRIFTEAETSNAILFFDEADALFGKRSEVKDSHDRYANIETGYLLQRMEEYEGVVILATNLRKNMDEAFVRRLHFTVEFPFPDEADRHKIWTNIWPDKTPRDPALDLSFMARRFEISGGNIRNIALAAAFLAADDGGRVDTNHLLRATKREFQKMGKVLIQEYFEDTSGTSPQ
jgi:SpoVK/Ycf46/Vps4 family AAA+-type ATPase